MRTLSRDIERQIRANPDRVRAAIRASRERERMSQREIVSRDIAEAAEAVPMTEPTAVRASVRAMADEWETRGVRGVTAGEIHEIEQAILAAEQQARGASEAVLAMAVARIGGEVEGQPTARHNFLQRIDALREIERDAGNEQDVMWDRDGERGRNYSRALASSEQSVRPSRPETPPGANEIPRTPEDLEAYTARIREKARTEAFEEAAKLVEREQLVSTSIPQYIRALAAPPATKP